MHYLFLCWIVTLHFPVFTSSELVLGDKGQTSENARHPYPHVSEHGSVASRPSVGNFKDDDQNGRSDFRFSSQTKEEDSTVSKRDSFTLTKSPLTFDLAGYGRSSGRDDIGFNNITVAVLLFPSFARKLETVGDGVSRQRLQFIPQHQKETPGPIRRQGARKLKKFVSHTNFNNLRSSDDGNEKEKVEGMSKYSSKINDDKAPAPFIRFLYNQWMNKQKRYPNVKKEYGSSQKSGISILDSEYSTNNFSRSPPLFSSDAVPNRRILRRRRRAADNLFTGSIGLDPGLDYIIDDFIGMESPVRPRDRRTIQFNDQMTMRERKYLLEEIAEESLGHPPPRAALSGKDQALFSREHIKKRMQRTPDIDPSFLDSEALMPTGKGRVGHSLRMNHLPKSVILRDLFTSDDDKQQPHRLSSFRTRSGGLMPRFTSTDRQFQAMDKGVSDLATAKDRRKNNRLHSRSTLQTGRGDYLSGLVESMAKHLDSSLADTVESRSIRFGNNIPRTKVNTDRFDFKSKLHNPGSKKIRSREKRVLSKIKRTDSTSEHTSPKGKRWTPLSRFKAKHPSRKILRSIRGKAVDLNKNESKLMTPDTSGTKSDGANVTDSTAKLTIEPKRQNRSDSSNSEDQLTTPKIPGRKRGAADIVENHRQNRSAFITESELATPKIRFVSSTESELNTTPKTSRTKSDATADVKDYSTTDINIVHRFDSPVKSDLTSLKKLDPKRNGAADARHPTKDRQNRADIHSRSQLTTPKTPAGAEGYTEDGSADPTKTITITKTGPARHDNDNNNDNNNNNNEDDDDTPTEIMAAALRRMPQREKRDPSFRGLSVSQRVALETLGVPNVDIEKGEMEDADVDDMFLNGIQEENRVSVEELDMDDRMPEGFADKRRRRRKRGERHKWITRSKRAILGDLRVIEKPVSVNATEERELNITTPLPLLPEATDANLNLTISIEEQDTDDDDDDGGGDGDDDDDDEAEGEISEDYYRDVDKAEESDSRIKRHASDGKDDDDDDDGDDDDDNDDDDGGDDDDGDDDGGKDGKAGTNTTTPKPANQSEPVSTDTPKAGETNITETNRTDEKTFEMKIEIDKGPRKKGKVTKKTKPRKGTKKQKVYEIIPTKEQMAQIHKATGRIMEAVYFNKVDKLLKSVKEREPPDQDTEDKFNKDYYDSLFPDYNHFFADVGKPDNFLYPKGVQKNPPTETDGDGDREDHLLTASHDSEKAVMESLLFRRPMTKQEVVLEEDKEPAKKKGDVSFKKEIVEATITEDEKSGEVLTDITIKETKIVSPKPESSLGSSQAPAIAGLALGVKGPIIDSIKKDEDKNKPQPAGVAGPELALPVNDVYHMIKDKGKISVDLTNPEMKGKKGPLSLSIPDYVDDQMTKGLAETGQESVAAALSRIQTDDKSTVNEEESEMTIDK